MPALLRQISRAAANREKWLAVFRQSRIPRVRVVVVRQKQSESKSKDFRKRKLKISRPKIKADLFGNEIH